MALFSQPTLAEFLSSINTSKYGDFSSAVSQRSNAEWASQLDKYSKAQEYFYGDIFDKRTGPGDSPLEFPLKLNLIRMMCITQAAALWGQWEDELITLLCNPLKEAELDKERAEQARSVIQDTYDLSGGSTLLYEGGLSQQIYGGVFLRAAVDPTMPHGIRFDKLMPYNVFVIWHPIIVDRILEAFISIPIDKAEAALAYGVKVETLPDEVVYLEHWTEKKYEVSVGGKILPEYSGRNVWGFVPIVYVPRVRAEGFYGMTVHEDLAGLQDELNLRLADIGDNINSSSHPIRWIRNFRGDPKRELEMGADALWNLGESMPGREPPEVGVLPAQPEPTSTFNFVGFLLDMTRQAAFTSPIAFGEDEGSQRSGVTLTLRLWPLLQQVKTTRVYWRNGLIRLHSMALEMVRYRDVGKKYSERLAKYIVQPNFFDLVPQDRQLLIDEIIRRSEQGLISPEEAIARFGVRVGTEQDEVKRIKEWMEYQNGLAEQLAKAGKSEGPSGSRAATPGPSD